MEKEKGLHKVYKSFLLGILLCAFLVPGALLSSAVSIPNLNLLMLSTDAAPGVVEYEALITPPPAHDPSPFISMSLTPTEVPSETRSFALDPQSARLQSSFIIPQNNPINRRRGGAGFTAALVSTVALHAADYFTTVNALKYSSLQEGNPFMKKICQNELLFGAIKLGTAGLQVVLLKGLYKKSKTLAWILGTAMNVGLSYVVANNFSKIQHAKSGL